jgi:hypothetical protein
LKKNAIAMIGASARKIIEEYLKRSVPFGSWQLVCDRVNQGSVP